MTEKMKENQKRFPICEKQVYVVHVETGLMGYSYRHPSILSKIKA